MDIGEYIRNKGGLIKNKSQGFTIALRECENFIDDLLKVAEREDIAQGTPGNNPHAIDFMETRDEELDLPVAYERLSIEVRLKIIYEALKAERDFVRGNTFNPDTLESTYIIAKPEYRRDLNLLLGAVTMFTRKKDYILSRLGGESTEEKMETFAMALQHDILGRMQRFQNKYSDISQRFFIKTDDIKDRLTLKERQRLTDYINKIISK